MYDYLPLDLSIKILNCSFVHNIAAHASNLAEAIVPAAGGAISLVPRPFLDWCKTNSSRLTLEIEVTISFFLFYSFFSF